MKAARHVLLLLGCLGISACESPIHDDLPRGQAAYDLIGPVDYSAAPSEYRIGTGDVVSVRVFQEPDLAADKVTVGNTGQIQLPLIGDVTLAGLTAAEASGLIESRLGARYLRNPDVVVSVVQRKAQVVAVEGQVVKPGAFAIDPQTTLLGALAISGSPTKTAKTDQIIVFRTIDGQRMAARFDLNQIRAGKAPDPQLLGGDVVVVGFSSLKGVYRDVLQAAPLFNIFTQL